MEGEALAIALWSLQSCSSVVTYRRLNSAAGEACERGIWLWKVLYTESLDDKAVGGAITG